MGKRIWKKPGTMAWRRALEKSAGRMARDILRAPESRRRELIVNYLRNRNPLQTKEQTEELLQNRVLDKAIERRSAKTRELLEKFESTMAEKGEIFKYLSECEARIKSMAEKSGGITMREIKSIRSIAEISLKQALPLLRTIRYLETNLPKQKVRALGLKNTKRTLEENIKQLFNTLDILDKKVAGEGSK